MAHFAHIDENNIVQSGGKDINEVWCEDCNEHTKCELKKGQ